MTEKEPNSELLEKVKNLPASPGVYRFLDGTGTVLYIGKAKDLRKRVGSYFMEGRGHSYRIALMVRKAQDLQFTVTTTESEALLLENNLIKQNQPRYNINLKDGKSYPFVCIKNESFPRIFSTRKKLRDGSLYFGPYANVKAMQSMLEVIRQSYQIRTCNLLLNEENIARKKFRTCLEYQIGNCGGPCEGKVSAADYGHSIESIKRLLDGNLQPLLDELESRMMQAAGKFEFEKAEQIRKRLEKLQDYRKRSVIFSEKTSDLEVATVAGIGTTAVVNHFRIRNGAIVQTHGFEVTRKDETEDKELLVAVISRLLSEDKECGREWLTNLPLEEEEIPGGISLTVPQRGEKRTLVELSLRNCKTMLEEKVFRKEKGRTPPNSEAMLELQRILHLKEIPAHIECFDNSNFQGTNPVASLVVFRNGMPSKKDYRHFKIRTVEGPNDFASMEEIVHRRYKRLLEENEPLPNLIMVDGGKGQLSSAFKSLKELGLAGKIPLISIAKKLEEIYSVNDPVPLHIDKRSPALKMLQQLRDEAHRFAITFHREKRSKAGTGSALENLPGIGKATAARALKEFRSIRKLREAGKAAWEEKLGRKVATILEEAIKKGEL